MLKHMAILAACLSLLVSACSKPEGVPSESNQLTTIRVGLTQDEARARRMDAIITAFHGQYPQYRVVQVPLEGSGHGDSTQQKLKGGELDLIQVSGDFGYLASQGNIVDLTPYTQRGNLNMAPYAAFLPFLQQKGRTYMLPYGVTPYVMLFNTGLTAEAGVSVPKGEWTWDQFRAVAMEAADDSVSPKRWGVAADHLAKLVFPCVDQAQRFAGRNDEQAVQECYRRLHELIFLDKSMAPSDVPPPGQTIQPSNFFDQGQAAMVYRVLPTQGQGPAFDWDWAPLPSLPAASRPVTMVATDSLAIATNSPNLEEAWTFLQFALGPEGAVAMAKAGFVPFYQSDEARDAFVSSPSAYPPGTEALLDTAWVSHPWLMQPDQLQGWLFYKARDFMGGLSLWEDAAKAYMDGAALIREGKRPSLN